MVVELPVSQVISGIQDLGLKVERHERELESLRQANASQRQEIERSRRSRLDLHVANLLRKATEKVMAIRGMDMPQGENDPNHSRYAQAVRLIKRDRWENDTNLPVKYWRILQQLPKITERRSESAHENVKDFAELLLTDTFYQKHEYHCWGDLFKFTYEVTVETVAQDWESQSDLLNRISKEAEEED